MNHKTTVQQRTQIAEGLRGWSSKESIIPASQSAWTPCKGIVIYSWTSCLIVSPLSWERSVRMQYKVLLAYGFESIFNIKIALLRDCKVSLHFTCLKTNSCFYGSDTAIPSRIYPGCYQVPRAIKQCLSWCEAGGGLCHSPHLFGIIH